MALNYLERTTGDQSPASFQCGMEVSKSSEIYLVKDVETLDQLYDGIIEIIGDVNTDISLTKLSRTLPIRHPFLPIYASDFVARGIGGSFQQITNPILPFTSQILQWCLYNQYELNVSFQPRPYPVIDDNFIEEVEGSWYPFDFDEEEGQELETFTYAKEYERYVNLESVPTNDTVTVQYGQLAFNSESLPRGTRPFTAQPRQYLNNENIRMTWWCVPYSYFTSSKSFLRRFRGYINQNDLTTSSMGTFPKGSLLYLGCNAKPYVPPLGNNYYNLPGTNIQDFKKYCNIEMQFLYTNRPIGEDPLDLPTNKNWVYAGFNLQPYLSTGTDDLSGTFLYASTNPTNSANSGALFRSCPMELLWSNPDFDQDITI